MWVLLDGWDRGRVALVGWGLLCEVCWFFSKGGEGQVEVAIAGKARRVGEMESGKEGKSEKGVK